MLATTGFTGQMPTGKWPQLCLSTHNFIIATLHEDTQNKIYEDGRYNHPGSKEVTYNTIVSEQYQVSATVTYTKTHCSTYRGLLHYLGILKWVSMAE